MKYLANLIIICQHHSLKPLPSMSASDMSFEGAEWNVAMPWSLQYVELIGYGPQICIFLFEGSIGMFERVLCRLFSLDILSRLASQDKWFSTVLLGHKTLNFHQYIFRKAGCKWHIILHISDTSWSIWMLKWDNHGDLTILVASYIRRQLPGGKGINLGHQEEEAHPVGGNRRICTAPKSAKQQKN